MQGQACILTLLKEIKEIKEGRKLYVGDNVRISKYKNIFAKGYAPNWYVLWKYVISQEIVGTFFEQELKNKSKRVNSCKSNKEKR